MPPPRRNAAMRDAIALLVMLLLLADIASMYFSD
jgi:hypothetical protein